MMALETMAIAFWFLLGAFTGILALMVVLLWRDRK